MLTNPSSVPLILTLNLSDVGADAAQKVEAVMTLHVKSRDLVPVWMTILRRKQVRFERKPPILIAVRTMMNAQSDGAHESDDQEVVIVTKTVPSSKGRAFRLGMKQSIL